MSQVDHPSHYNSGSIEVIDIIEDQIPGTGFHLGNAIKYICRAGKKAGVDPVTDLEKARWYLNRAIECLKKESQ